MLPFLGFLVVCLTLSNFYFWRQAQNLRRSRLTSEKQYQTIFETVTDGLIINSLDGRVTEANPAACQMHGYTRDEFLGQSSAEFVHPDSMHLFEEYVEALSAGRTFHALAKDIRKDGTIFDVEVDGVPFQFRGEPHLLGVVRDITQQQKTLENLRSSKDLNHRILEAVPGGIVHVSPQGAILMANEQAQDFLGLSLDQLTRQYVNDYETLTTYEDGRICDPSEFPVSRCLATGEPHGPLTLGVQRPDRTVRWAIFTAIPIFHPETQAPHGAIVTFLDITSRKDTEQQLIESQEQFRLLAENAPGVIYLCENDERYSMKYISESVLELTGYAAEEFLEDRISFVELFHRDDKEEIVRIVDEAIEKQEPFRLRYRIWHPTGHFRWIDEVGIGVYRDEKLVQLQGFLTDVTEAYRAEEKLRAAQDALIQQQQRENESVMMELQRVQGRLVRSTRLATIGKMAAQIAHEIRNPLGIIKNAAFFIRRKLPKAETRALENIELIQNEVGVCVEIIENILSITKIQPPRKTQMELKPFVEDAFHRLHTSTRGSVKLRELTCEFSSNGETPRIFADSIQFRQVLDNLLKNAVEAMDGKGHIKVTWSDHFDCHRIEVADVGPGIPESDREKVFEVFQTTKAKGTGLGLGICRQIVEQHGGELTLRPTPPDQHGATFIITLPKPDSDGKAEAN